MTADFVALSIRTSFAKYFQYFNPDTVNYKKKLLGCSISTKFGSGNEKIQFLNIYVFYSKCCQ
jgi:hypothetical protein